jgi:FHA domain
MPTFVIHALGQSSRKVTLHTPPIRVGRAPESHLVLAGETVSRNHAVFEPDVAGRWWVACVSDTNPIVVDGKAVRRKYVQEGSEVLIGQEHLVVFWTSERKAADYLGERDADIRTECRRCRWKGMIRAGSLAAAVCPDCGSLDIHGENAYAREHEIAQVPEGATALFSTAHVQSYLARLKAAKGSRIERLDGHSPARKDLNDVEPLQLSRSKAAGLRLFGMTFGGLVLVEWDGKRFVATSTIVFPGMKVNGVVRAQAPLRHEDIIEIGSNRFRFVAE